MGITEVLLGASLGKAVVDLFTPEEELEIPSVEPVNLEDTPDIEIGVDPFEGLTSDERTAKKRLRTDVIEFNNVAFNDDLFNIPTNTNVEES